MTHDNVFLSNILEAPSPSPEIDSIFAQYCETNDELKSVAVLTPASNLNQKNLLSTHEKTLYLKQDDLLDQALNLIITSDDQVRALLRLWHQRAIVEVSEDEASICDLLVLKIYEALMKNSSQSNQG